MTRFVRLAILFELGLAAVAFGVGAIFGLNPWDRLHPTLEGVLVGVLGTLPLVLLLVLCDRDTFPPMRRIRNLLNASLLPMLRGRSFLELALIAGAAGLGEETLFRGLGQEGLQSVIGFGSALLGVSVVFGLLHALTPTYAVLAALISVYLGLLLEWSGNLLAPIVAHGLYDLIALIYFLRTAREATIGLDPMPPEEETSP